MEGIGKKIKGKGDGKERKSKVEKRKRERTNIRGSEKQREGAE